MRFHEIIAENADNIIDLRTAEIKANPIADVFMILGNRKTLLYCASQDTYPFHQKIEQIARKLLPSRWQSSMDDGRDQIRLSRSGEVVLPVGRVGMWDQSRRNRYSEDVIALAKEILRRGLVSTSAPLVLRSYTGGADHLGPIGEIAASPPIPDRLILYHGTTDGRAQQALQIGLRPSDNMTTRPWKERNTPAWRDHAVYLTATPQQAAMYATRARTSAKKHKEAGQQMVILQVEIDGTMFGKLHPDDDYLANSNKKEFIGASVYAQQAAQAEQTWQHSLSHYGQVAYLGTIPPAHLSISSFKIRNRIAY